MIWFSALSLGFWGWFAGRRAGLVGVACWVARSPDCSSGLVVIGTQIVFKPH